ncbi:HAD family phosphatase [Sphingomonas sp. H39-1-10]|uniref:HAD family hydrolase n=1 Tax=Sphingomonas TaxID=13687 RepID=UPI0008874CC6|nr:MULTISPECIES: HAD family phosphatase [Sphingomonas]MDF0488071.1 HAD family phosphatase [Sphingomonas pollutisoli]SDA33280.1 haloacid dehalogenase superfamily, subfamily IA, variant 3 with third motif having DD or ED [Sphingomonas sp. NFR15]
MKFDGIIFDFDGVLIESESIGNAHLADYLNSIGHTISRQEAMARFMGLSGRSFIDAIETHIGATLGEDYHAARRIEDARVMAAGIDAVAGAVAFVQALPEELPKAIASSSSTAWIARHLDHIGLREAFGDHLYSGKEHVARGKPAPDLYYHAAAAIGVDITRTAILEDSIVGATGAVASGAFVIGFCGGSHCSPDHAERLRALGVRAVASDFNEVARLIG